MIILLIASITLHLSAQTITQLPSLTWQQFKTTYRLFYNTTEDIRRQQIYQQNITRLNSNPCPYCGITKYFASTQQQIQQGRTLFLPLNLKELADKQYNDTQQQSYIVTATNQIKVGLTTPSSLDWRTTGAVTPPKAQGSCGTCWSFATVGMCESSLILQGRAINNAVYQVALSEQYLLKCTSGSSCSGGYLENAIDQALNGLPYATQFPYNPSNNSYGLCKTKDLIFISNKTRVSKYMVTDNTIISMLQDGPIVAAVSATGWEQYSSGIFTCSANPQINHAVQIVGYTPTYWIIKNSWGTDFGVNGFIYVSRDPIANCAIGTAVHELTAAYLSITTLVAGLLLVMVML